MSKAIIVVRNPDVMSQVVSKTLPRFILKQQRQALFQPRPPQEAMRQLQLEHMRTSHFLHMSFGPRELDTLRQALEIWCAEKGVALNSIVAELAASALVNMFREGHYTVPALVERLNSHKSLSSELSL